MNERVPIPGESAEKRAERERAAAESRDAAKRMKNPEIPTKHLKNGGEQTLISRQRYHEWIDQNARNFDEMDSSDHKAIMDIDEGIQFFNGQPEEKRKRFLETADPSIFIDDSMDDEIKEGIRKSMTYLVSEGVFMKRKDESGKEIGGWMVDPDFASETMRGETAQSTIVADLHKEFLGLSETDKIEKLFAGAGDEAKLLLLPSELDEYRTNPDKIIAAAKKRWYEGLPKEKREEYEKKAYEPYTEAISKWNSIPEEQRQAYLMTGELGALAGAEPSESFDAGSEEGQVLTGTLARLETLKLIQFDAQHTSESADEADAWIKKHAEAHEKRVAKEDKDREDEKLESRKRRYDSIRDEVQTEFRDKIAKLEADGVSHEEAVSKIDAELSNEVKEARDRFIKRQMLEGKSQSDAEAAYDARYAGLDVKTEAERLAADRLIKKETTEARRQRMQELQDKSDGAQMERSDAVKKEIQDLTLMYPDLSEEEASHLVGLTEEERAVKLKLLRMSERESRGKTAETNFEGEMAGDKYLLYEKATQTRWDFISKEKMEEFARKKGIDLSDAEHYQVLKIEESEKDFKEMTREERIAETKKWVIRKNGEPLEEYEARIGSLVDASELRIAQDMRDEIMSRAREDAEFRKFVLASGKSLMVMNEGELRALMDDYTKTPEGAAAKLKKIEERIAGDAEFADFIKRNGIEPGLKSMNFAKLEMLEEDFKLMQENRAKIEDMRGSISELKQLMGVNFEIPADIKGMRDEEVVDFLDEIEDMREVRDDFMRLFDSNEGFKKFVQDKYGSFADKEAQKTMLGKMADKIISEWESSTGEIVLANIDMTRDNDRSIDELVDMMMEQHMDGGFKFVKRIFASRTRERYEEKAARLMDTGDASGRFWKKFDGVDAFLAEHRKPYAKGAKALFEAIYDNPEGMELAKGEGATAYRVRKEGDKFIVMRKNGSKFEDVKADGPDAEISKAVLGLHDIAREYVGSDHGEDAKKKVDERLKEITESLSEDARSGLRFDNFAEMIKKAGDYVDYGLSVDRVTDALVFVNAELSLGAGRLKLVEKFRARREEKKYDLLDAMEHGAGEELADLKLIPFGTVETSIRSAMEELKKNKNGSANIRARERLIKLVGLYVDFASTHGLVDYGEMDRDAGEAASDKLYEEAMDLLVADGVRKMRPVEADGAPISPEILAGLSDRQQEQIESEFDESLKEYTAALEEKISDMDFDIRVSDRRLNQLSGNNAIVLRNAVRAWNEESATRRFEAMIGYGVMPDSGFILMAAGLITPKVGAEKILYRGGANHGEILSAPKTDKDFEGVTYTSPITTLNFEKPGVMISDAMGEARGDAEAYTREQIEAAMATWNGATEMERRLYLLRHGAAAFVRDTHKVLPEQFKIRKEFSDAAEILDNLEFINRNSTYGLGIIDVDKMKSKFAELSGDPEKLNTLVDAIKLWRTLDRTTRYRCIKHEFAARTDRDGNELPAIGDDVKAAYESIFEAGILPEVPDYMKPKD